MVNRFGTTTYIKCLHDLKTDQNFDEQIFKNKSQLRVKRLYDK